MRHSFGDFLRRRLVARCLRLAAHRPQLEQRIADLDRSSASRVRDREALAVRDDDRRDQTLGTPREHVEIEVQQRLAAADACAGRHQHLEALAAKRDRVDADVQQDLGAVRRRAARSHGSPPRRKLLRHRTAHAGRPSVGSMATPSPSSRCAKTASGVSSSGAHQPRSGETSVRFAMHAPARVSG